MKLMIPRRESMFLMAKNRLLGHVGRDVDDIERHVADRIHKCVELDVLLVGRRILQRGHLWLADRGRTRRSLPISTFSNPLRMTVRLPLGISNIFMMRAAVPMRYMSSALLFHVAVALQDGGQHPVAGVGVAHERHAPRAAHRDGGDGARKQQPSCAASAREVFRGRRPLRPCRPRR